MKITIAHFLRIIHFLIWKVAVHGLKIFWPVRKTAKRIVFFRNDGLGDFVISLTSMRALSRHFHSLGYSISLVASKTMAPLAQESGLFDDITICSVSDFSAMTRRNKINFLRQLYPQPPEIVISLLIGDTRLEADMMPILSNASKLAIIFWQNQIRIHENPPIEYTFFRHYQDQREWRVERYFDVIIKRLENENGFDIENRLLQDMIGKATAEPAIDRLDWLKLPSIPHLPDKYYVVVPGCITNHFLCQWPNKNFAEIIDRIYQQSPEYVPIFLGTAEDKATAEEIANQTSNGVVSLNLCGKTDIKELIAAIKGASFYIGQDTGSSHLAGLLNIPSALILNAQIPYYYFPNTYYPNMKYARIDMPCKGCVDRQNCIYGGSTGPVRPCIANISVDDAWNTILSILPK